MTDWIAVAHRLPPLLQVVDTKIDDADGVRNQTTLKRMGNLWYMADGAIYVYYRPTHWRPIREAPVMAVTSYACDGDGRECEA